MTAHEQYQLLVGEIGIPRREYLYELQLWEIILITRGYWRRYHPGWEQARLTAYNARYCMGSDKTPPTVTEWLTFPWERERMDTDLPTEEELAEIQAEIQALNEYYKQQKETGNG